MKIIVDAMGGDNAPREAILGAIQARERFGVEIILAGRSEDILASMQSLNIPTLPSGISITYASQVIGMDESPVAAFKEKPDSSMNVALKLLAAGEADAMVSAGSTGALLTGAIFTAKRIPGIKRAALAAFLPTAKGQTLLLDCGANVDCSPDYLLQFGVMGSYYAAKVLGIEKPKVGLLNIGTEESKGSALYKDAYALMKQAGESGAFHFAGNVEGRDVPLGAVDVAVADGFAGNVLLKTYEGAGVFFSSLLKGLFTKNIFTKLAAVTMKGGIREFKKTVDYEEVGGAPLLGIAAPIIKAHGSSKAKSFYNAIRQAKLYAEGDIVGLIARQIGKEE